MTDSTQITPAAPKRRRRWPWIVGGLLLALVLFVLVAPSLFGGTIASVAASAFNDDHHGKLELGKLELAWFSRQKVSDARLLDPEGKEVARVSIDLPSLADLARSTGGKVGVVKLVADANLVADDAGLSNLQRALEENDAKKTRTAKEAASKKMPSDSKPTDIGALMRELDLALEISVPQLTWSDSHTRALGKPFELRDTVIKLDAKPGQPQAFDVKGKLASQNDAPLAVSGKLHDAFDAQGLSPKASFELQASVSDFPSGLIDALAAQDGLVAALMGERISVDAKGSGTLDAGRIDANLKGSDGEVTIACELKDRVLQGSTSRAVHVTSKLDAQRLQPLLRKFASASFELQRVDGAEFELAIDNLRVELGKVLDAHSGSTSRLAQAAFDATRLELTLTPGAWQVRSDMLGKQPLSFGNPRVIVQLVPADAGAKLSIELDSKPVTLQVAGSLVDGVWHGASNSALVVTTDLAPEVVSALATRFLPSNTSFALGRRIELRANELEIPLHSVLDAGPNDDALAILRESFRSDLNLKLTALAYDSGMNTPEEQRAEIDELSLAMRVNHAASATSVDNKSASKTGGVALNIGALVREFDAALTLSLPRVVWSDSNTRALGNPFELRATTLQLGAKPGEPQTFNVSATLASNNNAPLSIAGKLHDAFDAKGLAPGARCELQASVVDFPSSLIDALAAQDGVVGAVMGERIKVAATGDGTLQNGRLKLDIDGDRGALHVNCELAGGVLRGVEQQPAVHFTSSIDATRIAHVLANKLPPDVQLARVGADAIEFAIDGLYVDVNKLRVATNGAINALVDAAFADAQLHCKAALGSWKVSGAAIGAGAGVELHDLGFDATLAPTAGEVKLHAASLTYRDATDKQHEKRLELADCDLGAKLTVSGSTLPLALAAKMRVANAGAAIAFDVAHPNARELIAFTPGAAIAPVTAHLQVSALATSFVEQWTAGAAGLAAKLGDKLDIDVATTCSMPKGAPTTAKLDATVQSARGKLVCAGTINVSEPFALSDKLASGTLPEADAKFDIEGLALADGFLPADLASTMHELVGDTLVATLSCRGDAKNTALTCDLKTARIEFSTRAHIADRALHIDHDEWLRAKVQPTAALLTRYAGPSLPQGAKLAFADAEPLVQFETQAVALPLDAWMPAADKPAATLADVVRRTAAQVKLTLPSMNYEQPSLTAGAASVPIALENMAISASLAPSKPASVDVVGNIAGAQGGKIALHAKCADAGAFLDTKPDAKLPPLDVDGELTGMPTALVDALAAQNGLLVDTLGPTIDVKLHGSTDTAKAQPLTASCKSANASLDLVAQLDNMTLVAKDKQGLNATVPLNPLFSQRVVGKLVPLLVNASKPQGAAPVALQMSAFTLPLDGDMQKVNGTVNLSLGEVAYDLLPGLNDWLAKAHLDKAAKQNFKFAPMQIAIKDGVAHYDSLPINVAGEQIAFKGSYSLVDSKLDLSTQLPLKLLGSAVGKELEGARGALDPNMLVPISIKGTWNKPKVSLGDGFLEKALKDAGGGALKKGLEGLLGGKKDKKPEKKKDG